MPGSSLKCNIRQEISYYRYQRAHPGSQHFRGPYERLRQHFECLKGLLQPSPEGPTGWMGPTEPKEGATAPQAPSLATPLPKHDVTRQLLGINKLLPIGSPL